MAQETPITVVGNLTADPELRYTASGEAVANVNIASTPRTYDRNSNDWKDGDTLFMRGSIWKQYAENVAQSLSKGDRVVATGFLSQRNYETKEGEKRTVVEMKIEEIGPVLRYATARPQKATRDGAQPNQRTNGGGGFGQSQQQSGGFGNTAAASDDPWAQR